MMSYYRRAQTVSAKKRGRRTGSAGSGGAGPAPDVEALLQRAQGAAGAALSNSEEGEDESNKEPCTLLESDKMLFCGDVTRDTMTKLIATMYTAVKELPLPREGGAKPRMYLLLRTNGGTLYDALAAYDHLVKLRERVELVTVAEGFVASAGTVLLMAGSRRLATRNAGLLFHQLSSGMMGKYADLRDELSACRWLMRKLTRLYERSSSLSRLRVKRLLKRERTLSAGSCIRMGFLEGYY